MDQGIEIRQEIEAKQFDISIYISKYIIPVLEKKWIVLLFILLGVLASLVVNSLVKSEFISQGALVVEEPLYMISMVREGTAVRSAATMAYIDAETEKLKSTSFAAEVLNLLPDNVKDDLKMSLDIGRQIMNGIKGLFKWEVSNKIITKTEKLLGKEPKPSDDLLMRAFYISKIRTRVSIASNPRTGIVWITARSIDRDTAPILVKNYIDIWMAQNLEDNKRGILAETRFTKEQKNKVYREFKDAEKDILDFKRRYGIPGELEVARDVELNLEMGRLESNLKILRERYQLTDKVYLETQTKEAGIVGNIKVIDFPMVPTEATRSKVLRLILTLIFGGIGFGIGVPLLLDFIKGPIRHEVDITNTVSIPVLGYIPKI